MAVHMLCDHTELDMTHGLLGVALVPPRHFEPLQKCVLLLCDRPLVNAHRRSYALLVAVRPAWRQFKAVTSSGGAASHRKPSDATENGVFLPDARQTVHGRVNAICESSISTARFVAVSSIRD